MIARFSGLLSGLPRPFGVMDFSTAGKRGIRGLGQVPASAAEVMSFSQSIGNIISSAGYLVEYQTNVGYYAQPNVAVIVKSSDGMKVLSTWVNTAYLPRRSVQDVAGEMLSDISRGIVTTVPVGMSVSEFIPEPVPAEPVSVYTWPSPVTPQLGVQAVPVQTTLPQLQPEIEVTGVQQQKADEEAWRKAAWRILQEYDPWLLQQQAEQAQPRIVEEKTPEEVAQLDNGIVDELPIWAGGLVNVLTGSYIAGIPNWALGVGALVVYKAISGEGKKTRR